MKVEIEKKVKIELDSDETKCLLQILKVYITNFKIHEAENFAVQLKQELER